MTRALSRIVIALVIWLAVASRLGAAPPMPGKRGRNTPPAHSTSPPQVLQALARLQAAKSAPARVRAAADTLRLVALRLEFPDLAFGASPPADELHDRFYYEVQFSYLQQYFAAASSGRMHVQVDVPDGVALGARPQAEYGNYDLYDSLMVHLTGEAVTFFDAGVDFSAYDGFILLHAGPGQESDIAGDSPTTPHPWSTARLHHRHESKKPSKHLQIIKLKGYYIIYSIDKKPADAYRRPRPELAEIKQ